MNGLMLLAEDVWCSPVISFKKMVEDPQIKHNNMILEYQHPTAGKIKTTRYPVSFSDTPQKITKPAPLLNQHAAGILKEYCDYSVEDINAFLKKHKI